ncbi:hypothetical protein PRIC1_012228 [Phytophthora ramorum]
MLSPKLGITWKRFALETSQVFGRAVLTALLIGEAVGEAQDSCGICLETVLKATEELSMKGSFSTRGNRSASYSPADSSRVQEPSMYHGKMRTAPESSAAVDIILGVAAETIHAITVHQHQVMFQSPIGLVKEIVWDHSEKSVHFVLDDGSTSPTFVFPVLTELETHLSAIVALPDLEKPPEQVYIGVLIGQNLPSPIQQRRASLGSSQPSLLPMSKRRELLRKEQPVRNAVSRERLGVEYMRSGFLGFTCSISGDLRGLTLGIHHMRIFPSPDCHDRSACLFSYGYEHLESCEVAGTRLELRFRSTHQLAKQPSCLVFQSLEAQYIREAIWYLKNGTYMDASLREMLASPARSLASHTEASEQSSDLGASRGASVLMFFADADSLKQRADACCRVIGCQNLVDCTDLSGSKPDEASASNVMVHINAREPSSLRTNPSTSRVLTSGLCEFHASCLSSTPSELLTRQKPTLSRDKPPLPAKSMQPLTSLLQSVHYAKMFKFQGQLQKRQNARTFHLRKAWHPKLVVLFETPVGGFLCYYDKIAHCPGMTDAPKERRVIDLSSVLCIRPVSAASPVGRNSNASTPVMHSFDVVTLYRTWTFAALEPAEYEVWLHVLTECVEKHATIAPDKVLRFPVKLAMTGQTSPTEATSLEISSHGVSFCTGHEADVVLSTWYYTDLEKWSVVFQQGYTCCLLRCRSPPPASPGSPRAGSGDAIIQDYLFRTTEASVVCLAIEFYVGKCMAKLEILAGQFLEEGRAQKSKTTLVPDPVASKRGTASPKRGLPVVKEHPIENVSLAPIRRSEDTMAAPDVRGEQGEPEALVDATPKQQGSEVVAATLGGADEILETGKEPTAAVELKDQRTSADLLLEIEEAAEEHVHDTQTSAKSVPAEWMEEQTLHSSFDPATAPDLLPPATTPEAGVEVVFEHPTDTEASNADTSGIKIVESLRVADLDERNSNSDMESIDLLEGEATGQQDGDGLDMAISPASPDGTSQLDACDNTVAGSSLGEAEMIEEDAKMANIPDITDVSCEDIPSFQDQLPPSALESVTPSLLTGWDARDIRDNDMDGVDLSDGAEVTDLQGGNDPVVVPFLVVADDQMQSQVSEVDAPVTCSRMDDDELVDHEKEGENLSIRGSVEPHSEGAATETPLSTEPSVKNLAHGGCEPRSAILDCDEIDRVRQALAVESTSDCQEMERTDPPVDSGVDESRTDTSTPEEVPSSDATPSSIIDNGSNAETERPDATADVEPLREIGDSSSVTSAFARAPLLLLEYCPSWPGEQQDEHVLNKQPTVQDDENDDRASECEASDTFDSCASEAELVSDSASGHAEASSTAPSTDCTDEVFEDAMEHESSERIPSTADRIDSNHNDVQEPLNVASVLMDRTPPTANGSKPKVAVASPLRRVAPVSPCATSPKFPPIKKPKQTSPKKAARGLTGKGVSLPQVSSVTFASEIGTQELDSGEELEILKCILVREGYLQRLGRASTAGHIAGAHLGETVDVLDLLRLATLETVEAIAAWRLYKQKSNERNGLRPLPELEQFKWNGLNYLLKLASDLEFLGKHTGLTEWLGFSLQRNPFVLPLNLDCRAKLVADQQPGLQPTDRADTAASDRFLQVGGKRSQSTRDSLRDFKSLGDTDKSASDADALAQLLAERRRAKTPYETRVVNDEELVPNAPPKIGSLRAKSRAPARAAKTNYSSVLPSQIGEVDMARLHDAEVVVLREEAAFGRFTRDIHGRVVPEDEAQRRFSMVELSGNAYKVPAILASSYTAQDPDGNVLRLGDPSHSDLPGRCHAKKRSGMLGPISKPEWRSFDRPPPPRRRARGAQLEEALAAERKANTRLGVLLDSLREGTERKAMDVAYFESCSELQVYGSELHAFTTQAQRELSVLRREFEEKRYLYASKLVNIQKKEEMLNTFKAQHKAAQDATHLERIESSRSEIAKVASLNQEQQRREDQEQAAARAAAVAERLEHDRAEPLVQQFCATQIQKFARGMLAREMFEHMKIEFVVASSFIQAGARGFLVRRRVAKMYWHKAASVHLQRVARGWFARRVAQAKRTRRLREFSAERIQKVVRGRLGRVRMAKIRALVRWRLQLALAARSVTAAALKELATECQEMVALPALMKTEAKSTEGRRSLPALVLGLVRLVMIFTSDSDDEWNIPTTRWRESARFLRCGVSVTRRMQKIAHAAAGAARAFLSPSGGFAAAGVAASTPYLRESALGSALVDAYAGDLDFRVETFERIPRGWQAAVAIFKWATAFAAITRLQHLLEPSTRSSDPFLVVGHTLSKREAQHEVTERRDADHSDEDVARRFVPAELVQARGYPLHRPRPLLLVVANDVPRKAKAGILEKLEAALPGLFLTITRPPALKKRSLSAEDAAQAFDFQAIRNALALGHSVILEGDVGLRDVTQRAFLSCFATVKSGLHPPPMCVLLRGTATNRSDLFGPKQGSEKQEETYREELVRRMVDAEVKLALDRTTRLRLELAEDPVTNEMVGQSTSASPAPNPALVVVMEGVIVLLTPGKVYEGPSQSEIATSSVSWRLSRRLLAQPAFLRAKLQQVDISTIPPVNLVALERFVRHPRWPNAVVSRSQVHSSRLVHALAAWVESATRTARMIAADGTGFLAPEITRFGPVPGLFERVVVVDNCPTDHVQDGAGEDSSVIQLMDAVLADVRVYRTVQSLVSSHLGASSQHRKKKASEEGERCVVSLFHESRRIFASAYSPSTGQRWLTAISEDEIDSLLTPTAMPLGGQVRADKLPPQSRAEMYARLARLCLLQKRRLEDVPESIEAPSPYELVVRPHAVRLYRHALQLGGYLTTLTIAELARGHVQIDAFVHGSNSQKPLEQAVGLTLAVELENILARLSAAEARRMFVPSARIPSLLLDRLHLYCVTRSPMVVPEFQPGLVSALRLSVRTTATSPGRVLLRRAVRVPGDHQTGASGERWVFTLVERHERGGFEAAFYAPGSSTRHSIPLSRNAAQELLHLSRHTASSELHHALLRSFCFSRPASKVLEDGGSDAAEDAVEQTETMRCYRQRRRIVARFPCVLRIMEDPRQQITRNQLVRAYAQVVLCDQEPDGEEGAAQQFAREKAQALHYRLWLPGSCVEQVLILQESELEASLPVELSWQQALPRERRGIARQVVQRYFAWDPNGGGDNGCAVAHLPCGSFWATEVTPVLRTAPSHEDAAMREHHVPAQSDGGESEVAVVSCTRLLDGRDTESDDEEDDPNESVEGSKLQRTRKIYSYDTEELVHHGSYRANGLYVVVRVSMQALVVRDLEPTLASPTDRVRERDSFAIQFHVYHPASSSSAVAAIRGRRDLREVVGPDKPFLIASTCLDSLMKHIILTRLDAQVEQESTTSEKCLQVAFLRDRLYAKQKATPVTKAFERDSSANAAKLIDESRHRGRAGERGVKVLTTAKELPGCGRTLLTVFDVAGRRNGPTQESASCLVLLRVDAYVCATSDTLSLLLEGSDLAHLVGADDRELLSRLTYIDSSVEEVLEVEKKRSRKLASVVLDHLRVEQRSDGRGGRLVLSDYAYSFPEALGHDSKSKRLFKSIRAVGRDQVVLSVYLDKGTSEANSAVRLELYDPASSSRCMLELSHATLSALLGLPEHHELLNAGMENGVLMTHVLSFVHIEKVSAVSDDSINRPSAFAMTLLFDEQQAEDCMKQHVGDGTNSKGVLRGSWTGPTTGRDGKYFSLYLEIRHADESHTQPTEQWLSCSAFAPSELLVGARIFIWADIPAELLAVLAGSTAVDATSFFTRVSERLVIETQQAREEDARRVIQFSFS